MKITNVVAVAALMLSPIAVQAENLVAKNASSLERFFENEGADVETTVDNVGDPKLEVTYYGNEFSIYYYGCDDNTNCDAIQFFSGYKTDGSVRLSKINTWNAENRYARAYVSESGSARIEMDVYMGNDGVSADDFASMVSLWSRSMNEFEDLIDW